MGDISRHLEEKGFEIKDLIRWKKTNAMPRNRDRRFITDYEVAIWAVKKGGKWTFNRLSETYEIPEIVSPIASKGEKREGQHPTQKPIFVMEWLIERLSNKNDIILDPFAGIGSTCIACKKLDRHYIGIEIDDNYCSIALNRINKM